MTDPDPLTPTHWGLLDAQAQHDAFPDAFPIPSGRERRGLVVGDLVKLVFVLEEAPSTGPNAERMWVEVLARRGMTYEGRLTNQPTVIPGLDEGTRLEFDHRHVAGIALRHHEVAFAVDQHAVVTHRALARSVPPGWVTHDDPVDEIDSGWTVCAGDEPADHFDGDPAATTQAVTLAELAQRYPALVEVFQAGAGEWVYRPDHRRYVRVKPVPGIPTEGAAEATTAGDPTADTADTADTAADPVIADAADTAAVATAVAAPPASDGPPPPAPAPG